MNPNDRHIPVFAIIVSIVMIGLPVWFLGGNLPPVRTLALLVTAIAGALLLVHYLSQKPKLRQLPLSLWAAVPLALGIFYAAAQAYSVDWNPLVSVYPAATRLRLCELILGVTAFLLFSRLLVHPSQIGWFFGIAMVTGAATAGFGLIQHAGWNGKLYWFYQLIYGGQPFGPYVNGNNAGGFLLMCFAAGNFFLACRVFRGSKDRTDIGLKKRRIGEELKDFVVGTLAQLDTPRLYVCGAMILIAAGIATSLSRGALVALAVSTITGWMMLFSSKRLAVFFSAAVLLIGVSIALYTEGNSSDLRPTTVAESLQSMTDVAKSTSNRIDHWSVAWRLIEDHWLTGTGLGTYAISYPPYQQRHLTKIFVHAENQYLEAFAEMGVFGLLTLVMVIGFFLTFCLRLVRETDAFSRAVGVSGLMALVSQMIAGALDFGLYQPANTLLMAGMMGAVVGRKTWIDQTRPVDPVIVPRSTHFANQLLFVAALLAACWAALEYSGVDARVAASRFVARFQPMQDATRIDEMEKLVDYALSVRPDDAQNHITKADLKTLRYRIDAAYELVEAAEEASQENAPVDEVEPRNQRDERNSIRSAIQIIRQERLDRVFKNQDIDNALTQGIANDPSRTPGDKPAPPQADSIENQVIAADHPAEENSAPSPAVTIEDVWLSTQLNSLHRLSRALQKFNPELHQTTITSQPIQTHLAEAFEHLKTAEALLPNNTRVLMLLAQLGHIFDDPTPEHERIDNAIRERPFDSTALFTGGLLSLQSFRYDEGCEYWNRCLRLTRTFDPQIMEFSRRELTVAQFLNKVLPENPELLIRLARNYFQQPGDYVLKKIILDHTVRVVAKSDLENTDKLRWRGVAAFESRKYPEAIDCFTQVLETQSELVSIRVLLARALIAEKQYLKAIEELKVCQLYSDCPIVLVQRLLNIANRNQARVLQNLKKNK